MYIKAMIIGLFSVDYINFKAWNNKNTANTKRMLLCINNVHNDLYMKSLRQYMAH